MPVVEVEAAAVADLRADDRGRVALRELGVETGSEVTVAVIDAGDGDETGEAAAQN